MEGCNQYQRMKNRAEMPAGKLRLNIVPERLQQHILVDLITKLPVSRGYNSILVVCDRFLKMSYFIVMTEKIIAEGLVRLFRNNVWKLHKLLENIMLSIAFHSQTDGQIERINQELEKYLRIYINHKQSNQLKWLTTAEFVFNNKIHTVMKLILFKLNYGREPRMGFKIRKKGKHAKVEKKYINRNKKEMIEYKVGDKLLLSTKDLTQQMRNKEIKKLTEKFVGSYKENYIRKCGVVVTSIDENLPSRKYEQNSNISEAGRGIKEDHTFSSRNR